MADEKDEQGETPEPEPPDKPEFFIDIGVADDDPEVVTLQLIVRLRPHAAAQVVNATRSALHTIMKASDSRIIKPN
jgi:hypothetical protein